MNKTHLLRIAVGCIALLVAAICAPLADASPALAPASDYVTGCTGEYFNNMTLSGSPVLVRSDAAINFYWPEYTSPGAGVYASNYSVRWTCSVNVTTAGTYTFTIRADDGMNLLLDGNLLIWAWYDQGPSTYSNPIYLSAGTHTVRVEYYNDTLGGTAQVYSNISGSGVYYAPPPAYVPWPAYVPPPASYYPSPPPQLVITADNSTITRGQCTTLRWAVAYVQWFTVDGNSVSNPGAKQVCPTTTTTYTLQVGSAYGTGSRTATVNVIPPPPVPYYPPLGPYRRWAPVWRY